MNLLLAAGCLVWLGIVGLVMIIVTRRRNRRLRAEITGDDTFSALMLDYERGNAVVFNAGWTFDAFEMERRALDLPRPTAIADGCLRETLERVGLHGELLEPEMIESSPAIAPRRALLLI